MCVQDYVFRGIYIYVILVIGWIKNNNSEVIERIRIFLDYFVQIIDIKYFTSLYDTSTSFLVIISRRIQVNVAQVLSASLIISGEWIKLGLYVIDFKCAWLAFYKISISE